MNSVSTNKTVPRKTSTPVISNRMRRRGQRFPSGSENTNGVSPGGTSSGISLLICPDYKEVRTRKRASFQVKRPLPLLDLAWHILFRGAQATTCCRRQLADDHSFKSSERDQKYVLGKLPALPELSTNSINPSMPWLILALVLVVTPLLRE